MGTTLTALVEHREPGSATWWRVSSWQLGKDYSLMAALHRESQRDWPHDVRYRNLPEWDFHRYWIAGSAVITGITNPSPWWAALCASLPPLLETGETRVLFVEI